LAGSRSGKIRDVVAVAGVQFPQKQNLGSKPLAPTVRYREACLLIQREKDDVIST
jgi:hypothetical protein